MREDGLYRELIELQTPPPVVAGDDAGSRA